MKTTIDTNDSPVIQHDERMSSHLFRQDRRQMQPGQLQATATLPYRQSLVMKSCADGTALTMVHWRHGMGYGDREAPGAARRRRPTGGRF